MIFLFPEGQIFVELDFGLHMIQVWIRIREHQHSWVLWQSRKG